MPHIALARGVVQFECEGDGLECLKGRQCVHVRSVSPKAALVAGCVAWREFHLSGLGGVAASYDVEFIAVGPVEEDGKKHHNQQGH